MIGKTAKTMDSIILIAFAFLTGIFVTVIATKFLRKSTKESLQDDIEFLQFERDHREMIRQSKIHRDRVAKRSFFSALFFLSVVLVVSWVFVLYPFDTTPGKVSLWFLVNYIPFVLWAFYLIYVYVLWKRYKNLSAYQEHLYKIDEKIIKARKKLDEKK